MQIDIEWLDNEKRIVLWMFSGRWNNDTYINTANNFANNAEIIAHYMIWDLQNLIITEELNNSNAIIKHDDKTHTSLQVYFSHNEFQKLFIVIDSQHPFTQFLKASAIKSGSISFIEFAESIDEVLESIQTQNTSVRS